MMSEGREGGREYGRWLLLEMRRLRKIRLLPPIITTKSDLTMILEFPDMWWQF